METSRVAVSFSSAPSVYVSATETTARRSTSAEGAIRPVGLGSLPPELVSLIATFVGPYERTQWRSTSRRLGDAANGTTQSLVIKDLRVLSLIELNQFTSLKNLIVPDKRLVCSLDQAWAVVDALQKNRTVTSLDLSDNALGFSRAGYRPITHLLRSCRTLISLTLRKNCLGIGRGGAQVITEALGENSPLISLDLSDNALGFSHCGLQAIANTLYRNTILTTLNLNDNHLGYSLDGMRSIADTLRENVTLTAVTLRNNRLGKHPESTPAIASVLRENSRVVSLDLRNNRFNATGMYELRELAHQTVKTILL